MRLATKILILFVILAISLELTNARKGPKGDMVYPGIDCPRVKITSSSLNTFIIGTYKINPKKVRDRHVYKLESENVNRWIAMCPGPIHGRLGWCIGNESTMETDAPVLYESGSTANEPWQAGTFKYWDTRYSDKVTVKCAYRISANSFRP